MIYFDHNATSPLCAAARAAWLNAVEMFPANPASQHRPGARAETALENGRILAAELLGCSPLDLVWTSGATEANNAVFFHASLQSPAEAWVSALEHPSVLEPARRWFGHRVRLIPVTRSGIVDLDWISNQLKQVRPALVAVMAANNETGILQPWRDILQLCQEREVPFACDAAQWLGKHRAEGLGKCDFLSGCAHKFGGPVGIGFLKVPAHFRPFILGGEQEHGRRSGTQNVAAVLAMMAAWNFREEQIKADANDSRQLSRDSFVRALQTQLPGIELLGDGTPRLWNTATVLMPTKSDCRIRWVVKLDKLGFAVSSGSACASGKAKPSHVLTAMGYGPQNAERMLRFSAGWETTEQQWKELEQALVQLANSF